MPAVRGSLVCAIRLPRAIPAGIQHSCYILKHTRRARTWATGRWTARGSPAATCGRAMQRLGRFAARWAPRCSTWASSPAPPSAFTQVWASPAALCGCRRAAAAAGCWCSRCMLLPPAAAPRPPTTRPSSPARAWPACSQHARVVPHGRCKPRVRHGQRAALRHAGPRHGWVTRGEQPPGRLKQRGCWAAAGESRVEEHHLPACRDTQQAAQPASHTPIHATTATWHCRSALHLQPC